MVAIFVVVSAASLGGATGLSLRSASAIVGGQNTTIEAQPWQVAFPHRGLCGGTVLSDRVILTAAHCTDDLALDDVWLAVGSTSLDELSDAVDLARRNARTGSGLALGSSSGSTGVQARQATAVIEHPSWVRGSDVDLALVVVSSPLSFGPTVAPLPLATAAEVRAANRARVTGWGNLRPGGTTDVPDVLQEVIVGLVGHPRCHRLYNVSERDILCAGSALRDAARGDSGGPLVVTAAVGDRLAGVTSFGSSASLGGAPGAYVRTASFSTWIRRWLDEPTGPYPLRPADLPPIQVCGGDRVTLMGTEGADVLRGTDGRDVIRGLGGDDVIYGAGGDDVICGDGGNDLVFGGPGNDHVEGGAGRDQIRGGPRDDDLFGGAGNDLIEGQRGVDFVEGGLGNDRLAGGLEDDFLFGGPGRDVVRGGPGDDELSGGRGQNQIFGGFGTGDSCRGAVAARQTGCELGP